MKKVMLFVLALCGAVALQASTIEEDFSRPPRAQRPWVYWLWQNGNMTEADVTADLESIEKLGFGGVLMFDNRGYGYVDWLPPVGLQVMTEPWFDRVAFAIRECARLGLEFSMNASSGGGSLSGFRDGKFYEVDITDPNAVSNHLESYIGPIVRRVPEAVGKTFTHIYSVSWEGRVPNSVNSDERDAFILKNFYGVMRNWAHGHGFKMSSESGGPWHRTPNHFAEADQLAYLGVNDLPQGEFWPQGRLLDWCAPMSLVKPVACAAHARGLKRVSAEAFTHMTHHWSVDPAFLKTSADEAFADGANHLVWHTFTASPERWGVPGVEYFAGSHINRNVTWHDEAPAFVDYLARCQVMLQYGESVADLAINGGRKPYLHWGRHRIDGHDWDLLDESDYQSLRRVGDRLVLPSGRSYPAVLPPPDCVGSSSFAHRRSDAEDTDIYFLVGEIVHEVTLRAPIAGRQVEIWDAVTGNRRPAGAQATSNGMTRIPMRQPKTGSAFVVFRPRKKALAPLSAEAGRQVVAGPWNVSFAYHSGVRAEPPKPVTMTTLEEFTTRGDLRHFAGRATYRTSFVLVRAGSAKIRLGAVPSGLARVFVNGCDCGVVWCDPWEADVSAAVRAGRNELEIRYVNNWHNRLVGDCMLPSEKRITKTPLPYWDHARDEYGDKYPYSKGYSSHDPLLPSGLLGPLEVILFHNQK